MRKQILSLLVVLLIGSTVCMAQDRQKGKVDREKRIEQIITDLGLNEKQAKDFKAAMEEMRPTKRNSNERPSREEMQKKRKEGEAKIKSILTDEQYKKYQDMRKKENADRKKSIHKKERENGRRYQYYMLTERQMRAKSHPDGDGVLFPGMRAYE